MPTPSPSVENVLLKSKCFYSIFKLYGLDNAIDSMEFSVDPSHGKFVDICKLTLRRLDRYDWYIGYSNKRKDRLRSLDTSAVSNAPYFSLLGLFLDTWDNSKWQKVENSKLPSVENENKRLSNILGIPLAYVEILSAADFAGVDVVGTRRNLYHEVLEFLIKMSGHRGNL